MVFRFSSLAFFLIVAAASATAQVTAQEAQRQLRQYEQDLRATNLATGKPRDPETISVEGTKKAKEILRNVHVNDTNPVEALLWVNLFRKAERYQDVIDLCQRFLKTKPEPSLRYRAMSQIMHACHSIGDADTMLRTVELVEPGTPYAKSFVALLTTEGYADTIAATKGAERALKVLEDLTAKLPPAEDPKEKARQALESSKAIEPQLPPRKDTKSDAERLADLELMYVNQALLGELRMLTKKADLLVQMGKLEIAIAELKTFAAKIGTEGRRSLPMATATAIARLEMIGKPLPKLEIEKSFGGFESLESLKGKVVLIDVRPILRLRGQDSLAQVKALQAGLREKGLEVVSLTYYVGAQGTKEEEYAAVAERMKEAEISWPLLYTNSRVFEQHSSLLSPLMILIDRLGNVRHIRVPGHDDKLTSLRPAIERLLQEK